MVAIPDFLAGAMENWGLITFRETTLLVGNHSSPLDKQLVTSVIAHELAHQVSHHNPLYPFITHDDLEWHHQTLRGLIYYCSLVW